MERDQRSDWDPRSPEVLADQIAAYDTMRGRCPVAHSDYLGWSLFRHQDVVQALNNPDVFSNAVSAHVSIPNGQDPPEHTAYREIVDRYFTEERMSAFEPACGRIAATLAAELPTPGEVELMEDFARTFALQVQSAFLGWPDELLEPLREWVHKNHRATLARDRAAMAAVALEFDGYIEDLLDARRSAGDDAPVDLTTSLLHEEVHGRPLRTEEIVSILRNWTVGELSTIAASVGILTHHLAVHPDLQQRLRERPADLPAAIEEILRVHAPLIANRRVTTTEVEIGGRPLPAGERVTLVWASANRDESAFADAETVDLDRDQTPNLLWGAGIHVCPGAPLARMELRLVMAELLQHTEHIELVPGAEPTRASYPASGFSSLPLQLR